MSNLDLVIFCLYSPSICLHTAKVIFLNKTKKKQGSWCAIVVVFRLPQVTQRYMNIFFWVIVKEMKATLSAGYVPAWVFDSNHGINLFGIINNISLKSAVWTIHVCRTDSEYCLGSHEVFLNCPLITYPGCHKGFVLLSLKTDTWFLLALQCVFLNSCPCWERKSS